MLQGSNSRLSIVRAQKDAHLARREETERPTRQPAGARKDAKMAFSAPKDTPRSEATAVAKELHDSFERVKDAYDSRALDAAAQRDTAPTARAA